MSEGIVGRVVLLIVGTLIGIWFVLRYAERVKKDQTKSLVYNERAEIKKEFGTKQEEGNEFGEFTTRHKVILTFFALIFVVMILGVIPWGDLGLPIPT